MKNIPKLLGSVLVLAAALLAVPSFAGGANGTKSFTLSMSSLGNGVVQADIMNTSPATTGGTTVSSIGSVDLFVDLGWTFDPNSITVQGHPYKTKPSQQPPGHIKVSNVNAIKPGVHLIITFSTTRLTSSGDGTFHANVYTGSSFNGNLFIQGGGASVNLASVAAASLACNESFPPVGTALPGPVGSVYTTRGWNKDGSGQTLEEPNACDPIPYFPSDTTGNNAGLAPDVLHFRWDQGQNSSAAFLYTIFYSSLPPEPFAVGWLDNQGNLATNPGVDFSNVARINAPDCMPLAPATMAVLPQPLGHLTQGIDNNASSTILHAVFSPPLPTLPFAIVVGTERMEVMGPGPTAFTWTVQRNALNTGLSEHFQNDLMMSTPLPPIPADATFPYVPGNQAQMCAIPGHGSYTDANGNPVYSKQIIDIGDGWGLGR